MSNRWDNQLLGLETNYKSSLADLVAKVGIKRVELARDYQKSAEQRLILQKQIASFSRSLSKYREEPLKTVAFWTSVLSLKIQSLFDSRRLSRCLLFWMDLFGPEGSLDSRGFVAGRRSSLDQLAKELALDLNQKRKALEIAKTELAYLKVTRENQLAGRVDKLAFLSALPYLCEALTDVWWLQQGSLFEKTKSQLRTIATKTELFLEEAHTLESGFYRNFDENQFGDTEMKMFDDALGFLYKSHEYLKLTYQKPQLMGPFAQGLRFL